MVNFRLQVRAAIGFRLWPRKCMLGSMKILLRVMFAALLLILSAGLSRGQEKPHDFSGWEKGISAFETMDRTNPPPKNAVLFIGSSTIRGWTTLAADFPGQSVINRGFGGSQIVDATHFAGRIIFPYAPRKIFFRSGGNDLWAGKPPEEVFSDFKEFVSVVQAGLPETEIFYISLSPSPARWKQADKEKALNAMVEEFARQTPRVKYIETFPMVLSAQGIPRPELFSKDSLHFNAAGYELLKEKVKPYLSE